MVTKRTGNPRGRPPKPMPPRRDRGRPTKFFSIRNDPARFQIAMLDAMLALQWGSERACAAAIVAYLISFEASPPELRADGYVVTRWRGTKPGAAATIDGRVATLREKRRIYRSEIDLGWRTAMGAAFQAVLAVPDRGQAESIAMLAATMAGEEREHARLLQLIAARFSGHFSIQAKSLERV